LSPPLTILVAARNEAGRIGTTVRSLRGAFPDAEVIVADDGSTDATADEAESAGASVLRLTHRGKGEALSAAERAAPPGRVLLCDADLVGELGPLLESDADLAVAAFAERQGGGFGIAKRTGRALIRALSGFDAREPLSGQRVYSAAARAAAFPLAPGFGCEVRGTIDVARAGLRVEEIELPLQHRATGRDVPGFLHRGRQLRDLVLGAGPLALNHRGRRLPLIGWVFGFGPRPAVCAVAMVGLADDLWSGPERGFRAHLGAGRTTGVLKLVAIPAIGLLATRRLSAALLVGLSANALNQLDTRPGRALKAFLLASLLVRGESRRYFKGAVLLLPYDLREMTMLGDAGANALGAVVGLSSVDRFAGRSRVAAIAALTGLTILGERRSLGALIERTPVLRELDSIGRRR
jgi:glucosyl-3-phosphoglycerate synthase